MVEVYLKNAERFTTDMQPQYVYSPRELTRWVRALHEGLTGQVGQAAATGMLDDADDGDDDDNAPTEASQHLGAFVRLWAHEAHRLFCDRLVDPVDADYSMRAVDGAAREWFGARLGRGVGAGGLDAALRPPVLFSSWLSRGGRYEDAQPLALIRFCERRLRQFQEEAAPIRGRLVATDIFVSHALRISRVLRQKSGHVLMIGPPGVGKSVLARFVAWCEGFSVFRVSGSRRFTISDFEENLRELFRRSGVSGERIVFLFDESSAMESSFLERMNSLLASGDVPGLFEAEDRAAVVQAGREAQ